MAFGTGRRTSWWAAVVTLLALVWIGSTLYFLGRWLSLGLDAWAHSYDGTQTGEQASAAIAAASNAALEQVLIAMVGPLVTAIVAAVGRLRVTPSCSPDRRARAAAGWLGMGAFRPPPHPAAPAPVQPVHRAQWRPQPLPGGLS